MTTSTQNRKLTETVAQNRAISALALVLIVVVVSGCDNVEGRWSWANGISPGTRSSGAHGAAVALREDNAVQVAMAAPAVTDAQGAFDQKRGAGGGMKRLAQAGNQHPADRPRSRSPVPPVSDRRPLVVIRFDRPDVPYEPALYTALSRALERRPSAIFDLVAVSPSAGSDAASAKSADEAQRDAERVMRTLSKMGLPAERVTLSAMFSTSVRDNEVRIFVR